MGQVTWDRTAVPALRTVRRFLGEKDDAGRSKATVETYERALAAFLEWFGKERDVNEIDDEALSDYLRTVKERGVSKHTQAHVMRHLKVWVRWLAKKKYIEAAPDVVIPKTDRILHTKLIGPDDFATLIRTLEGKSVWDYRNMALLSLLYDSGARIGEILSLDTADVNIDARTAMVDGKSGQRIVFFSHETADLLDRYRRKLERVANPEAYFVVANLRRMGYPAARSLLRRAKERSGVSCDVNPHNFRHSFATNFLRNGGDLGFLKELMGHSTFEVTKLYMSLDSADLMEAHRKFAPRHPGDRPAVRRP